MRAEMGSDEITAHLQDTRDLALSIGRVGTPFFVVDGEIVNGANLERLNQTLGQALERAG
jgi:2-hydroxychromene-2-carboxylate isomerase